MARLRLAAWLHQTSPAVADTNANLIRHSPKPTSDLPPTSLERNPKYHVEGTDNMVKVPTSPKKMVPQPTTSPSKMGALAQKISTETERVESYFREKGLPTPSFDVDAPSDFPKMPDDIMKSRREVIQATQELQDLMVGPRESVRWMAWDFMRTQSLQLINHFEIAKLVPIEGSITFSQLQTKTSLDPINLARILRYAMTNHLFQELKPGVISHTAASRLLVEDQALQAWVGFNTEDIYPGSAHVIDALKYDPKATDLTRAGFNFAFNTVDQEPMFVTFGKQPRRAQRMGQAMSSLTGGEGYELSYLSDGLDLAAEDARGGTFVDIGGSHGFVCVHLARQYGNLQFIVQDLARTVESAPAKLRESQNDGDSESARRVRFMVHDFFTEQPVRNADVYFFRWIMHNYSTPYAVQILRNLVPALKPGARIIINDHCLSDPGVEDPWDERLMRSMDLVMMTLLNAQEREEQGFRRLFELASDGFVFKGVTRPKGGRMSIVEAVWKPDEVGQTSITEGVSNLELGPGAKCDSKC
ncbi:S-adenosyl-L-methionine-dependent methyltransferase [Whalleya microplaca]|nr:S-adenosyl-L-methionine-dependent methyltransferase [Whalleya microplaca]